MIPLGDESTQSAVLLNARRVKLAKVWADIHAPVGLELDKLSAAAQVAFLFQGAQAIKISRDVEAGSKLAGAVRVLTNNTLMIRVSGLGAGLPVARATIGHVAPGDRDAMEECIALAEACGWAPRISDHLGLTVLTGDAQFGCPVHSSTNPALWHTVHIDFVNSTLLMARDLVHEATHTALNTALDASTINLDKTHPRYYSPWKQEKRPAFGFIHSIVSFTTVVDFLLSARDVVGPTECEIAGRLVEDELSRLKSTRHAVAEFSGAAPPEIDYIVGAVLQRYWDLVEK